MSQDEKTIPLPDVQKALREHPAPWHVEWIESTSKNGLTERIIFLKDKEDLTVASFDCSRASSDVLCTLVAVFNERQLRAVSNPNLEERPRVVQADAKVRDLINLSIERLARAIRLAEGEFAEAPEGSVARNYLQGVRNGLAEAQLALIKDAKLLEIKQ